METSVRGEAQTKKNNRNHPRVLGKRVGIARALYHDPPVIVMDEATSALDNVTERVVMEAVQKLGAQKTIILIAHRLTTIQEADKIFVLNKGVIVESGTHRSLLEREGLYRHLYTLRMAELEGATED